MVANITLAVGAGALTVTSNESPMRIAVVLGLAGTTPVPPFSVNRLMPKVLAGDPTVTLAVTVEPAAATVTVTVPAVAPVIVTARFPFASVTPVAGVNVTVPVPAWDNVTAAPAIEKPPASLAVTVMGVGAPTATAAVSGFTVTIEPMICTGSMAVAVPAVAVIVAVRLALLAAPEENVAVALPVASVVTVEVESRPVSALRLISTPGTDELVALTARIVIVLEFELSVLIVVGVPDN